MVGKMAGQVIAPDTKFADLILIPTPGPTQFEGLIPYLIPPHYGDPFVTCMHTQSDKEKNTLFFPLAYMTTTHTC